MISIDDPKAIPSLDPGGMLRQVASFPVQLRRAREVQHQCAGWASDMQRRLQTGSERRHEVLVCGMGGSAIGGEFAGAWVASMGLRVSVLREYGLPAWSHPGQLLVFSSYSGNTEETLSAYDVALEAKQPAVCITTGGALAERARRDGLPLVLLPGGLQPRAALGHSLTAQLVALHACGLLHDDPVPELEATADFLQGVGHKLASSVQESENPAKQLARLFHDTLPFIYSGSALTQPIATRWKGQLNENAKALAVAGVFPEMNHNEIMAWSALPEVRSSVRLFLLRDVEDPKAVRRRMQITAELLEPHVAAIHWLDTHGSTRLQRILGAVFLGDHASVYLAFLNGTDPTPVEQIEQLKKRLAAAS